MKGFTLVELLTVIIILGIISLITIPTISKSIQDSKEKMYQEQVNQIETVARNWAASNTVLLPENGEIYYLSLSTLKETGFLENKNIQNPKDNSIMKGCVLIEFDESINQYTYDYVETCN